MKIKVLIFPHTCRRDVSSALVLEGFLIKENFDVQITSMVNLEKWLKFWKPEILIVYSHGKNKKIKEKFKNIKIIFIDGEVFQLSYEDRARQFSKDATEFDSLDLILVGGELAKKSFKKFNLDTSKVHVVGNTRFDTARFLMSKKITRKKEVGFVGSFPLINHHSDFPVIRGIKNDKGLKYGIVSLYGFNAFYKALIYVLKNTNYQVSLRPHPNESIENYKKFIVDKIEAIYKKRIHIDASLDFSIWASKLSCIVSPTSTSIIQATLVGTPVLNLSNISGQKDFWNNYAKSYKNCNSSSIIPKDLKNLKYQLNNIKHKPIINKNIQQQLNKECDWKNEEYSNLRSAIIINKFSKNIYRNYVRLPKFFLRIIEFFVFKKALKNNAKILNFNYCEFFHSQPNEVSTLVNERLKNGKL